MACLDATSQDGTSMTARARVRTRKGLQVSTQKYQDLKIIHHSLPKPLAGRHAQGSAKNPGPLLVDFDSPQTGLHRESRHKELEHRKRSRELAKNKHSSLGEPRSRARAGSSRSKQLRVLAPASATRPAPPYQGIPQSIDGWMVHEVPIFLSQAKKNAIRSYLDVLALRTYPYDWRNTLTRPPLGTADIYASIMQDLSALNCAISIGAVNDVVHRRAKDPTTVAYHCAELCSAMKALLAGPQERPRQVVLVHGVAALALMSLMMGECQEWHLHMKGLRSVMPDRQSLPPSLQWLAVRTDLIGSCELAVKPYLSLQPRHRSILREADASTRTHISNCVRRSLSTCCRETALETFISLGLLGKMVESTGSGFRLDPDPLMEQSYILWSELLSRPIPMWELQKAMPECQASGSYPESSLATENAPHLVAATEALAFPRCVECAVRIALLMYAKKMSSYQGDLVWQRPCLLHVYVHCLRKILTELQQITNADEKATFSQGPNAQDAAKSIRPAVTWLCLMGWVFGKMFSASEDDMSVFRELLVYTVGSKVSDVDAFPDCDLQFCLIYNLEVILGHKWSAKDTMKSIIALHINERGNE